VGRVQILNWLKCLICYDVTVWLQRPRKDTFGGFSASRLFLFLNTVPDFLPSAS
jgi:hypothetical protein